MSETGAIEELVSSIAESFASMTEGERIKHNAKQLYESDRQHADFKAAFDQGGCYLCKDLLTAFDKKKPCLHWYLLPDGVRKKDFPAVFARYGMMATQAWMRWVANEGEFASKIADTADDDHIVRLTAQYKKFSWSISCTSSDFSGHGKNSNYPHYHLQMWINDRPFISYNNFHIRIPRDELIALKSAIKAGLKAKFPHGESYDDVVASVAPETIIRMPVDCSGDPSRATFNISTMIVADKGTSISGQQIYDLFQHAKSRGVTVASLADSLPNVTAATFISEGPAVIEPMPRSAPRGTKRRAGAADASET